MADIAPLPVFPQFRPLASSDRPLIEDMTAGFPPYSDFTFTSLWAWDTDASCQVASLHGNLVIRLKDYETDDHFYTFIGKQEVVATARSLLDCARGQGLSAQLKLIPELVVWAADWRRVGLAVTADRDNFDYLHATADWARFDTAGFHEHRRRAARCRERGDLTVRPLILGDPCCQRALLDMFDRWAAQKVGVPAEEIAYERAALARTLTLAGDDRLQGSGVYAGGSLVGFSLWEVLPGHGCAVLHFQKADRDVRGLSSWLAQELGRTLCAEGCARVNIEQDVGIAGLRTYKESLQPCQFLRKYVISEHHP